MTKKEINESIAKYCGIKKNSKGWWVNPVTEFGSSHPPDYYDDLNAMHDAENKLSDNTYEIYWKELMCACIQEEIRHISSAPAWLRATTLSNTIKK